MVDVRGDVLRPPHGITPAAVIQQSIWSSSITIFLFDALKQTESMLSVPNEWVMENVYCYII